MEEKSLELAVKTGTGFLSLITACWVDVSMLVSLLFGLVIIDNLIAIYRACLEREKGVRWFDYKKLRKTIEKFISYGIALVVAWIIEKIIGAGFGLTKFVSGYIAIYEGMSIYSHIARITGLNLFADIVDWLKNKADFKKYFNRKKQENE